ncbi:hypothetical protein ACIBAC_42650 [Streptomyces sp. NPDC051362]
MWTRDEDRLLTLVDPIQSTVQDQTAAADSGNEGPPQESPP